MIGYIVYPFAMDLVGPSLNYLISSNNTSVFEKFIYSAFPLIMAFSIVLFAIGGGLKQNG